MPQSLDGVDLPHYSARRLSRVGHGFPHWLATTAKPGTIQQDLRHTQFKSRSLQPTFTDQIGMRRSPVRFGDPQTQQTRDRYVPPVKPISAHPPRQR